MPRLGLALGLLSPGSRQRDRAVRVPSGAAGPTPAHTCGVQLPARLHRALSALFPASQRGLLPGRSGGAVTVQNRERPAVVSRCCEHWDGGSRPLPGAAGQLGRHRCIPDPGHGCIYPPAVPPGAADSLCCTRAPRRPSWWHQPSARVWKLFLASLWPRNNISEKNQSLRVCFFFLPALERSRCLPWVREPCARCRAPCACGSSLGWHPARGNVWLWGGTRHGEMYGEPPRTAALNAREAEQPHASALCRRGRGGGVLEPPAQGKGTARCTLAGTQGTPGVPLHQLIVLAKVQCNEPGGGSVPCGTTCGKRRLPTEVFILCCFCNRLQIRCRGARSLRWFGSEIQPMLCSEITCC